MTFLFFSVSVISVRNVSELYPVDLAQVSYHLDKKVCWDTSFG